MIKQFTTLIVFLSFSFLSFGQSVTQTDSILIMSKVKAVFHAFNNPVFAEFKNLSTEKIYCIICFNSNEVSNRTNLIERTKFFKSYLRKIRQSESFKRAISSNTIYLVKDKDYRTEITVLFTIYKKDELAPVHEGGQLGMHFRKVNNVYKFAGVETIP